MPDPIDAETFTHLVDLASFAFEPAQADYLRTQLNNQLKAIQELAAIPLEEDTPVSLHGVPDLDSTRQPLRPDIWLPFENRPALTGQMPQFEDGYVIVPDIPHTTLE